MDLKKTGDQFYAQYGNRKERPVLFFSPGRVNLIGEHTDYNGGFVFPCALNYGTYLYIRKSKDNILRFRSLNIEGEYDIDLSDRNIIPAKKWIDYPLGVIKGFLSKKVPLTGLEMMFYGDVPNAAGLSSSASIEMVTATALNDLFSAGLSTLELVKLCQKAENEFVGMNCGIMDQFAVGFGKKNHAIFLNCDTLEYENVPVVLDNCSLIITNTNKKRGLTDSKYNERRGECDKAVEMLQAFKPIRNLSELKTADLPHLEKFISDPVVRKRAKHVISENGRVVEAVKVLRNNNIDRFGELMNLSHDSLKNDYEVTGTELDTLVYEARKLSGVIGSRMTGAGFGGCTVSIVRKDDVVNFRKVLAEVYLRETGLTAGFYEPETGEGARRLE
jgi:galactokinase